MPTKSDCAATAAEVERLRRNLVLCFDGTGDWLGSGETNVALLFRNLVEDDAQIVFYDGGIGTLTNSQALTGFQRLVLRLIDLGVATGLRDKVLNGYTFLVRHYRPGDRVYLFGFSRGAFTARLVASMVENFGLLRPQHEGLVSYLWQTLSGIPPDRQADELNEPIGAFKQIASKLKGEFSHPDVKIHFMGLFDTVSSVGIVRRFNVYPNTDLNPSVLRVCHAVSIDEQRNAFPEALMHPQQPGLTEVWFPGVHRDVGGGLPNGRRRIADEALAWIEGEAHLSCARFQKRTVPNRSDEPPTPNYPSFDPYVFMGFYPMKMFVKRVSGFRFIWPNFRHSRVVPENALVHEVALELRQGDHYRPANLPGSVRSLTEEVGLRRDSHYVLRPAGFGLADAVGILLGAILMVLLWNQAVGGRLGEPWPAATAECAAILGAAFLGAQAAGQSSTDHRPVRQRPRAEGMLGPAGAAAAVALAVVALMLGWTAFGVGLAVALPLVAAAQAPGLPTLSAIRALPYLLWGLLGAAAFALAFRELPVGDPWKVGAAYAALGAAALLVVFDVLIERDTLRRAEKKDADERYTFPPPEADRSARHNPAPPAGTKAKTDVPEVTKAKTFRPRNLAGSFAQVGALDLVLATALRLLVARLGLDPQHLGHLPVLMVLLADVAIGLLALTRTEWWYRRKVPLIKKRIRERIESERVRIPPNRPLIKSLEDRLDLIERQVAAGLPDQVSGGGTG